MKSKYKLNFIFLVILSSLLLYSGCSNVKDIHEDSRRMLINANNFHALLKKGNAYSETYLVWFAQEDTGMWFDGSLGMFPISKAKELSSKYGDFSRCSNPGANEAKESSLDVLYIVADPEVKSKMNKLCNIINTSIAKRHPVRPLIKLNVMELEMEKLTSTVFGKESPVAGNLGEKQHFLVKDVEIITENYLFPEP